MGLNVKDLDTFLLEEHVHPFESLNALFKLQLWQLSTRGYVFREIVCCSNGSERVISETDAESAETFPAFVRAETALLDWAASPEGQRKWRGAKD